MGGVEHVVLPSVATFRFCTLRVALSPSSLARFGAGANVESTGGSSAVEGDGGKSEGVEGLSSEGDLRFSEADEACAEAAVAAFMVLSLPCAVAGKGALCCVSVVLALPRDSFVQKRNITGL